MRLKDRAALVTGGSDGIGREICLKLAQEGCKVAVLGRNRDRQAARPDSVQAHLDLARVYRGVDKLAAAQDALAAADAVLAQAPGSYHPAGSIRNPH